MWGDYAIIAFYPKMWQAAMFRSLHPWLIHMSMWHYWFWISFILVMNLFFIFVFKTLSYQLAEIRGTRSVGEKRRIAWPEMLIVLLPLFWAVNIITNALTYLRVLEGSSGYVLLSVQVSAYQWGWKYCYNDSFYPEFYSASVSVGDRSSLSYISSLMFINRKPGTLTGDRGFVYGLEYYDRAEWEKAHRKYNLSRFTLDIIEHVNNKKASDVTLEVYFCRTWLKDSGIIDDEAQKSTRNKLWHGGYWITAQGVDSTEGVFEDVTFDKKKSVIDPLRLLRSTGALVLPTRVSMRLMSCSEDITHSWAVPGLGFKMDCVPGRLFCLYINIAREGIYFGQCSELCGWNHYNMPVVVYALPVEHFIVWWELELHSSFNDVRSAFNNKHYRMLNLKYK